MSGFLFILVPVIERIMKSTTRYRKYYSGSLHQKLYDICHDVNFVSTPTHCFFYNMTHWLHTCNVDDIVIIIVKLKYSNWYIQMILSSCENHTKQQQQKLERLVLYTYLDQQEWTLTRLYKMKMVRSAT